MTKRKVHLTDEGHTVPYCKRLVPTTQITLRLEEATCQTCINLATLGRR